MFTIKRQRHKCLLRMGPDMTVYNAAELREKLMPVLQDERALEINLADVVELDSAGLQLLMLAKRERRASGRKLSLTSHSPAVVDLFELMGLVSYFNDPVVLPGNKGAGHAT